MSISLVGKSIEESPTLLLNEKAAILKAKGEPEDDPEKYS